LAFLEPSRDRLGQFLGKNRSDLFFPPLQSKIDNSHQRHLLIVDTLGESKQFVFAGGGIVITLEGWRGTAQHNGAFLDFRPDNRYVSRVIAWCFFLFVSRL